MSGKKESGARQRINDKIEIVADGSQLSRSKLSHSDEDSTVPFAVSGLQAHPLIVLLYSDAHLRFGRRFCGVLDAARVLAYTPPI
jgi:hypothetical protein